MTYVDFGFELMNQRSRVYDKLLLTLLELEIKYEPYNVSP